MNDSPIEVTPDAAARLRAIAVHISELGRQVGHTSAAFQDTAASWTASQANVWRLLTTGGRLSAGEGLSLGLTTSYGMFVAVIFFPDRSFTPRGTGVLTSDDYWGRYCHTHRQPADPVRGCDQEMSCVVTQIPIPGTWSLHS